MFAVSKAEVIDRERSRDVVLIRPLEHILIAVRARVSDDQVIVLVRKVHEEVLKQILIGPVTGTKGDQAPSQRGKK